MKKLIMFVFLFVLVVLALLLHQYGFYRATYVRAEEPVMTHQQEVWLHTLQFCESKGQEDLKFLDSNNRYSFGVLQFQMETFLREGKNYGILDQNLTPKKAEKDKLIYSIDLQEKIAHQMLLNKGEENWHNCFRTKLKTSYPKN